VGLKILSLPEKEKKAWVKEISLQESAIKGLKFVVLTGWFYVKLLYSTVFIFGIFTVVFVYLFF